MGVLMRNQGVAFDTDGGGGMTWIADHWTPEDMDALDAVGPDVYFAWVERGYAGD